MPGSLSNAHRKTYDAVLAHPEAHNLHWPEVRSMLNAVADVADLPDGKVKVTRNA